MPRTAGGRGPTIIDVAKAVGVSVTTVSRVVRGHADVRAQTRARVLEVIEELGYRPSSIARALVSGQTRLLALLVSDIANPFYPQLAKNVELEAKRDGYAVVICNTADRILETRRYIERLLQQGLDGVIHAAVGKDENVLVDLMADHRRIVFTNRRPAGDSVSYVVSDNEGAAQKLTGHLLSQGHRRIGFIAGPEYASNAAERLQGFRDALRGFADAAPLVAGGTFSAHSGQSAVRSWMDHADPPTAIIAVNDSIALGVLETLTSRGLRVPEDVALAGFDGVQLAASPLINLTTADQHIDKMGKRAVRILLSQINSPPDVPPVHEVLPTRLVLRESTEGKNLASLDCSGASQAIGVS